MIIYTLLIASMSLYIGCRVIGVYRLSGHKGLKFFSIAFCFFAASFLLQSIPNIILALGGSFRPVTEMLFYIAIIFFMSISAFYLVYSLSWKYLERKDSWTSRLHVFGLYIIAFIIAVLASAVQPLGIHIYFIAVLAASGYAALLSYNNYQKQKSKRIAQMFFIAMILWFIGYGINYIRVIGIENLTLTMYVLVLTVIIFGIVIYNVHKAFGKK
jgi:hypothetical protein